MSQPNPLYPIFLKLETNRILIIGGGKVAAEKLLFILKNSPEASIHIKAIAFDPAVLSIVHNQNNKVTYEIGRFHPLDIKKGNIILAATNCEPSNQEIVKVAHAQNKLVNVADTPGLCDFYLGAIVTRGPLKIAISTNGESPTMAKRIRQWLEHELPVETDDLIHKLHTLRNQVLGGFGEKVKQLNKITSSLIANESYE